MKQFFNENPPPYEDNSGSRQHYVASAADRHLHDEAHSSFYLENIRVPTLTASSPDMRAIPVLFMELGRASVNLGLLAIRYRRRLGKSAIGIVELKVCR
ncbi:hypothetical protein V1504DRAFT_446607 [Lipomyces starkeyi]